MQTTKRHRKDDIVIYVNEGMKGVSLHLCFDLQASDQRYHWKKDLLTKSIDSFCSWHELCSVTYTNDNFAMLTLELPGTSVDVQQALGDLVHGLGELIAACRYQYNDIGEFSTAYIDTYELFNLQRNDFARTEYSQMLMDALHWSLTGQNPHLDQLDLNDIDDMRSRSLQKQYLDYLQSVFSVDTCFVEILIGGSTDTATVELNRLVKTVKTMLSCTLNRVENVYDGDAMISPIGPIMVNKPDMPSVHLAQIRICNHYDNGSMPQMDIQNIATMLVCNQLMRRIMHDNLNDIFNNTIIERAQITKYVDSKLAMEVCISQNANTQDNIVQEFAELIDKICNLGPNEVAASLVDDIKNDLLTGIDKNSLPYLLSLVTSVNCRLADKTHCKPEMIVEAIENVTANDVHRLLNKFSNIESDEHDAVKYVIPGALGNFSIDSPHDTIRPLQDASVIRTLLSHFKAS